MAPQDMDYLEGQELFRAGPAGNPDKPPNGDDTVTVTFTIPTSFNWNSLFGIDVVIVKAANEGNSYIYDPPMES